MIRVGLPLRSKSEPATRCLLYNGRNRRSSQGVGGCHLGDSSSLALFLFHFVLAVSFRRGVHSHDTGGGRETEGDRNRVRGVLGRFPLREDGQHGRPVRLFCLPRLPCILRRPGLLSIV